MESREIQLFKILGRTKDYVSADSLCKELNIKPRTLREDLKKFRDSIQNKSGSIIESKTNKGYRLVIQDETRFYAYVEELLQEEFNQQYIMPVTQDDRVNYMIRYFLSHHSWIKSDDLAQEMYVSRSTFSQDLKLVKEQLSFFHLKLITRVGSGMKIDGEEKDIRSCISKYYIHGNVNEIKQQSLEGIAFGNARENQVRTILLDTMKEHQFKLTDIGFHNLVVHLLIALYRIEDQTYIFEEKDVEEKLKNTSEWEIAKDLSTRLEKEFSCTIPDSEVVYMTMHLKGKRALSMGDESAIRPEVLNMIQKILQQIKTDFSFDFLEDIDLFCALAFHIQPLLSRATFGLQVNNPLLEHIIEDSPLAYEMATSAAACIYDIQGCKVDENEIGYLALHFQLAIERYNNCSKKNLLVVCASGAGTSQILKYKLTSKFKNKIDKIDVVNAYSLDTMDLSNYDAIVSTIPLENKYGIPVLHVQYYLDNADEEQIQTLIEADKDDMDMMKRCIQPSLFFHVDHFDSVEQAIHFLTNEMKDNGVSKEELEKLTIEREKISSTAIGNQLAMPHPVRLVGSETKLAVCMLKKPMDWYGKEVRVILFFVAKKATDDGIKLFNKVMAAFITNKEMIQNLIKNPTYSMLMKEMEELCVIQKEKKNESIFE